MTPERALYALNDWVVERRPDGWYFATYRDRRSKRGFRGPYRSEASVSLMIAREMMRELVSRQERQAA